MRLGTPISWWSSERCNCDAGECYQGISIPVNNVQPASDIKSDPGIDEDRQEVVFAKLVVTAVILLIVYAIIKRGRNNVRPPKPRQKCD
jgi:hypothetical protein